MIDHSRFEERTITSSMQFSGHLVNLRVDTVRLPDGREARREVVEHPGAVALVAIDDAGCVVLVRQWRHPVGRVSLELPAGTLEPGEDIDTCARRELFEETGFYPRSVEKLVDIHVSPGYSNEVIHLFVARELQVQGDATLPEAAGEWVQDADENLQTLTVPLREAVGSCLDGEISDAKTITGILLAHHLLEGDA